MASINDETLANERVKQQALLMVADKMPMDCDLMFAMALTGDYLNRVLWDRTTSVVSEGSKLEREVFARLQDMRYGFDGGGKPANGFHELIGWSDEQA